MKAGSDIPALTGLRGVAAIYVVLYHYLIPIGTWKNPGMTLLGHGYLAVDVFFVLSGFVMALNYSHMFKNRWSRASYFVFLGRRIARIYPVYFVTTVIAFALVATGIIGRYHGSSSLIALIENLLMVQCWWGNGLSLNAPAWSLSTEWFAYLIFPLLLIPTLMRGIVSAVISYACALGALAFLCSLPPHVREFPNPQSLLNFVRCDYGLPIIRCVADFTLGLLTYRIAASPFGSKIGESRWMPNSLCILIFTLFLIPKTDFMIVMALPPLLLAIAFGRNLPLRLLSSGPAMLAGRYSYSLYLTHQLAGSVMGWVNRQVLAAGLHHPQTIAAAVGILITVPASFCLYQFVEMPGRNHLRRVFEGRTNRNAVMSTAQAGD